MEEIKKHPAYGLIGISRVTSSHGVPLFGSSIQHKNTICLRIFQASNRRDLNRDWYYAEKQVIEVEMSQSQFAELITTPNIGDGVPCTIRNIYNERIPNPDFESKKDLFDREFQEKVKEVTSEQTLYMQEALEILKNKTSISKKDRELIEKAIKMQTQHVKNNMPFVYNQFQEQMDKTVTEAKAEIEAFYETKVRNLGLEALKQQMPELNEAQVPKLGDGK